MHEESGRLGITLLGGTDTAVLRLSGELDGSTADSLIAGADVPLQTGQPHLIIDCGDLTFCDSYGLRAMEVLADRSGPAGSVTIVHPSETLNRLFDCTRLGERFQVVGNHRSSDVQRYRRWTAFAGGGRR